VVSTEKGRKGVNKLYALILAGGSGTRLWPLSRRESPKQFMDLRGEMTLFQETVGRLRPRVPAERMLFVTSAELENDVQDQLRKGLGEEAGKCRVVAEPEGRNTAPAILLGAWIVHSIDPDAVLLTAPSDHVILDNSAFSKALDRTLEAASGGMIVTYGIKPTRPETGYGYIKAYHGQDEVLEVERFEEKPDLEKAKRFLKDGNYFWNSGIFMFSVGKIIEEARNLTPDIMSLIENIDPIGLDGLEEAYREMPKLSFDHGIMEKTASVAVLPVSFGWNDVGSWDSYYEMMEKDNSGNVVSGDALSLENENCLVLSKGRLAAVTGMKDAIIIQTEDAVMVCPREQSQDVRKIVDQLEKDDRIERIIHPTVNRPWGSYKVLTQGENYKVKRFIVQPGQKMSLQKHSRRSEHWVVVKGGVFVIRGDEQNSNPTWGSRFPLGPSTVSKTGVWNPLRWLKYSWEITWRRTTSCGLMTIMEEIQSSRCFFKDGSRRGDAMTRRRGVCFSVSPHPSVPVS
jgi:mannose-1-phosphate guanylyltransferase/mannose-6-phosphate isomerase